MHKDSLFIVTPIIGGAFGIFFRWLQNSIIFDPETGLALKGAGASWLLVLLCIAFAVVCYFGVRNQIKVMNAKDTATVFGGGKALSVICVVMGCLTILGGLLTMLQYHNDNKVLWVIFSLLILFWGVSLIIIALNRSSDSLRGLCCAIPVITCCFWLILFYKINANEPVLWKFAMDFLAICANAIAWYYVAGFHYKAVKLSKALYFSQLAIYFDLLIMADSRPLGMRLIFLCPAVVLLCMTIQIMQSANKQTAE